MARNAYTLNDSSSLLLRTAIASGIEDPEELACLMGNAHVETGGFSTLHESFRYRSARAVVAVVSSADDRFTWKQIEDAVASRQPQQIATIMYERRRDLGNTEPGDGWRFHGRGYFQYTGRANYAEYGRKFGVDLVGNPDLAAEPRMAAMLAVAYWRDRVPTRSRTNIEASARIINGGENGMGSRVEAAKGWAHVIDAELVASIKQGWSPEDVSLRLPLTSSVAAGSATAATAGTGSLRDGASGIDVTWLQSALNRLGYRDAEGRPLEVDGDFGRRTREAVEGFQRANGLEVDGVVGRNTRDALRRMEHPLLTDARHPRHAMFLQVRHALRAQEAQRCISPGLHTDRLAGAVLAKALDDGLTRVDRVELGATGQWARAVQFGAGGDVPELNRVSGPVSTEQAVRQPLSVASEHVRQAPGPAVQASQDMLARQPAQPPAAHQHAAPGYPR